VSKLCARPPGEYLTRIGESLEDVIALGLGRAGSRLAHIAAVARHVAR
jgi:hypothetical protein